MSIESGAGIVMENPFKKACLKSNLSLSDLFVKVVTGDELLESKVYESYDFSLFYTVLLLIALIVKCSGNCTLIVIKEIIFYNDH